MDGEDLILRGGQGIRFLPGSVYSSADLPEQRGEFFWLAIHVPKSRGIQLPGFHEKSAHSWWQRATDAELPRRFPLSAEIQADLANLVQSDVTNIDDKDSMHQTRLTLDYGSLLLSLYSLLGEPLGNHRSKEIQHALQLIEDRLSDVDLDANRLAQEANISVSLFYARFKKETGLPPVDYLRHRRIIEAQRILSQPNPPAVTELAMKLGFSSSQYFATVFKRYTRLSPSEWRKRQF
jgi:AraC-like DNA-binding protein